MSKQSKILELEREIEECKESLFNLENEEEIIRKMQSEIASDAEEPVQGYDMTVSEGFRGELEEKAEDIKCQICIETCIGQDLTSKLLLEIVRAKERILEHIEDCLRQIEQLSAELETDSSDIAL